MKKTYELINERLESVDFNQICLGFHKFSFAVFNERDAILNGRLIRRPKQFLANSAVEYNGQHVATFCYDLLSDDLDYATSLIVHEMFHAFQFSDLDYDLNFSGSDEKVAMLYDYTIEAITLKYNEAKALINSYLNASKKEYELFLSIRKYREEKYPREVTYEKVTETMEGFATYAELMTLKQLNPQKYDERISKLLFELKDIKNYFSIRELSYRVGVLILLTLDQLNFDFEIEIVGKKYISDLFEFHLSDFEVQRIEGIEAIVRMKLDENEKHVEDFFGKNYEEIPFDKIVGYNPMGAIRHENKLSIKYLMIIEKDGVEQTLNGYFCLMFDNDREWVALFKGKKKY